MEVFLATCIVAGTPLALATLGELITEKSGSLNLGVEGMMLIGAVMGFIGAYSTHNPALAIIFAGIAGGMGALIFAFLTVTLKANQTVTGLTLTIFGTGFSSFVGQPCRKRCRSFLQSVAYRYFHKYRSSAIYCLNRMYLFTYRMFW